jgi:predicted transcriptional regulator
MATVNELWQMARDLYARARTSIDPSTKQMLMKRADDLPKQAEELRYSHVIQAAFPKPDRKIGYDCKIVHRAGTLQRAL